MREKGLEFNESKFKYETVMDIGILSSINSKIIEVRIMQYTLKHVNSTFFNIFIIG